MIKSVSPPAGRGCRRKKPPNPGVYYEPAATGVPRRGMPRDVARRGGSEYTRLIWDQGMPVRVRGERERMAHEEEKKGKFLDSLQDYVTVQQVANDFGLRMRGYRKENGRTVVETDEGPKDLRRLRHGLDEYRFACEAAEFLRGQGFSRLPRAAWAPSGSPIATVNGTNYTMHDWVPGLPADLGNLCQLTQAVEMLAWFHRCGRGFNPAGTPPARNSWGSWPGRFAGRIEEFYRFEDKARASEAGDRFSSLYLKHFEPFLSEAAKSLQELESCAYARVVEAERERGGVCHRDYTGRNLVMRADGALFLNDFDDLTLETRLEDLGKFIAHHANWDLERTLFILQVYHGVNPLTRAEVECLGAYLRFPSDFWSIANAYFDGKPGRRHAMKRAIEQLPARRRLVEELHRADLGFLAGAAPLYNLAFANLPETPAGKSWTAQAWPSAEGMVAADADWWQMLPGEEEANEALGEPVAEEIEPFGQVMEEDQTAGGWPEAAMDPGLEQESPPTAGAADEPGEVRGRQPGENAAPAPPQIPEEEEAETGGALAGAPPALTEEPRNPVVTWRPFPKPLPRPVPGGLRHG
ncbi:MAG: CotS family spore coat protein [Patescibacteria group bacterium]